MGIFSLSRKSNTPTTRIMNVTPPDNNSPSVCTSKRSFESFLQCNNEDSSDSDDDRPSVHVARTNTSSNGSTDASCLFTGCGSAKRNKQEVARLPSPRERQQHQDDTNNNNKPHDGEAMVVNELNLLSTADRQQILEDLHGVRAQIQETEPFIAKKLKELNSRVDAIDDKIEYERAAFLNPAYVKSTKFQLAFLRADLFDAKKAAQRLVLHFKVKQELFGPDKIGDEITWDDLDDDDKDATKRRGYAFLGCDSVGRQVFLAIPPKAGWKNELNRARAFWFSFMTRMMNDEAAQKTGVVFVNFSFAKCESSLVACTSSTRLEYVYAMPYRSVGAHVCVSDQRFRPFISMIMPFFPREIRLRLRTHCGTPLECMYSLAPFGITPGMLPINHHGELDEAAFDKLCYEEIEMSINAQMSDQPSDGALPRMQDIVCGRGYPYRTFPGNERFLRLVQSFKQQYDTAQSQFAKTAITIQILQIVRNQGSRFLKRRADGESWEEVQENVARIKVAMTFRNLSRKSAPSNSVKQKPNHVTSTRF